MLKAIRTGAAAAVNAGLGLAGLRVVSTRGLHRLLEDHQRQKNEGLRQVAYLAEKRMEATRDIHDSLSALLCLELPPGERRIELLARLTGMQVSLAMYLLAFLHRSLRLVGDVCEFGVAGGATSALLANELLASDKHLWLFDSFQGLPAPSEKDTLLHDIFRLGTMEKYQGAMAYDMLEVRGRLAEVAFPPGRTQIVPGFIEDTLRRPHVPAKVCWAFVDLDFYAPIQLALQFLHERLARGGIVMVHDYGHFSSGAQTAVDEFLEQRPGDYEVISTEPVAPHCRALQRA